LSFGLFNDAFSATLVDRGEEKRAKIVGRFLSFSTSQRRKEETFCMVCPEKYASGKECTECTMWAHWDCTQIPNVRA